MIMIIQFLDLFDEVDDGVEPKYTRPSPNIGLRPGAILEANYFKDISFENPELRQIFLSVRRGLPL